MSEVIVVAFDDGGLEVPRARQDRAEIPRRESSTLGIGAVEHGVQFGGHG